MVGTYLPKERDSFGRFIKKENYVENSTKQVNENEQQK